MCSFAVLGVRGMLPNRVMQTIFSEVGVLVTRPSQQWFQRVAVVLVATWESIARIQGARLSDGQDGKLGIELFGTVTCMGSYT